MFLIIGLGNIGEEYANTRHNIGFMVVDKLSAKWKLSLKTIRHSSFFVKGEVKNNGGVETVILAKPLTYVNLSGRAVKPLADAFSVLPNHIIVVHDDVDLGVGRMKVKIGGSDAGHKGIHSILDLIDEGFVRIRVGIGRPDDKSKIPDFVLSPFNSSELPVMKEMLERAAQAVETIILSGVEAAQRNFNNPLKKSVDYKGSNCKGGNHKEVR